MKLLFQYILQIIKYITDRICVHARVKVTFVTNPNIKSRESYLKCHNIIDFDMFSSLARQFQNC